MPLMVNDEALRDFREQLARGVKRPRLHEGAFDEMTPQLKRALAMDDVRCVSTDPIRVEDHLFGAMRDALDQMSPQTRTAIYRHLGRDQGPLLPVEAAGAMAALPEMAALGCCGWRRWRRFVGEAR
jgi:hypothetical protein